MNRYPAWMYALVIGIVAVGALLALPNAFGTVPALQVARTDGEALNASMVDRFRDMLVDEELTPEAAYLDDGRVVMRFGAVERQLRASDTLRDKVGDDYAVALTLASRSPAWVRDLGLEPMSLGLDLRGGVYFLYEVDMEAAIRKRLEMYVDDFETRLTEAGIARRVRVEDDSVRVQVRDAEDLPEARRIIRNADEDLNIADGGDGKSLVITMTDQQIRERQNFAIEQNTTTLRNRVNALGVAEPLVQRQGVDRIVVQLPGIQDPARADAILGATATLEFRLVDEDCAGLGSRRYPFRDGPDTCLKREVIASGDQIVDASSGFSQDGGPAVFIRLDAAGGDRMLKTTRANIDKPMAVLFIETTRDVVERNGDIEYVTQRSEEIINVATIRGVFRNEFQITGLNPAEARDLALLLRAGSLAAPIFKVEERTIGPSLGQENIDRGFMAVTIGFLTVVLFMAIYYRSFGLIADLALFTNLVLIVALLSLFQASLTLPGIAGIVLTVGMAVDANVLIFERIREEVANGNSPQAAIHAGYEKAFSSIADAQITTLIAAIVLFTFGTGPIKGFAITLTFGIITSMFTAIIGTRAVVNAVYGSRRIEAVPV
ncbi:MAG: protein translocase subunit SecD [Gammaproteobacteria bacterium]|nr:protein translocase subunit SecD [Gammaproteobacteria bacterium]